MGKSASVSSCGAAKVLEEAVGIMLSGDEAITASNEAMTSHHDE